MKIGKACEYSFYEKRLLLSFWYYHYNKAIISFEELTKFNNLVDARMDDIFKLIILEHATDICKYLKIDKSIPICNYLYFVIQSKNEQHFLDDIVKVFNELNDISNNYDIYLTFILNWLAREYNSPKIKDNVVISKKVNKRKKLYLKRKKDRD